MNKVKELFLKHKSVIMYLFFGVCTTAVNFIVFYLFDFIHIGTQKVDLVIDNTVSWIASVLFAYVTNKKWVFESKVSTTKELVKEIGSFFSCRLATFLLDTGIIYVCVTVAGMNKWIIKILSNVLVIILNYVGSKLFVFKKTTSDSENETVKDSEKKIAQDSENETVKDSEKKIAQDSENETTKDNDKKN